MKTSEKLIIPFLPGRHSLRTLLIAGLSFLGTSAAWAETVQITLIGNEITLDDSDLIDDLSGDLTGDGVSDLFGANGLSISPLDRDFSHGLAGKIAGSSVEASFINGSPFSYDLIIGDLTRSGETPSSIRNVLAVAITDERINGGEATEALLEIEAVNASETAHSISLLRLIFDNENVALPDNVETASTFPEWYDPIIAYNRAHFRGMSAVKKIAALERQIKALKASIRKLPRVVLTKSYFQKTRQLAALQRRQVALMHRAGR